MAGVHKIRLPHPYCASAGQAARTCGLAEGMSQGRRSRVRWRSEQEMSGLLGKEGLAESRVGSSGAANGVEFDVGCVYGPSFPQRRSYLIGFETEISLKK